MTVKKEKTFEWGTFRSQDYERRTAEMTFDFGVFKVKGLSAIELAQVREAVERNSAMAGLLEKISDTMSAAEKLESVSEILGLVKDKVPDQCVRQYSVFEFGVYDPKPGSRADVIKFADVYPVEFNSICTKIFELTGQGSAIKKKSDKSTPNEKAT